MTKQTALLLLLLAGWIDARASEAARPVDTVTATGPLTDGSLFSDSRWGEGTPVSLQAPSNVTFSKPPEKTQVRVLWNPDFLLVRFDCEDRSIVRLPGSEKGQRDLPYFKADAVEVFLDPVGDGRTYMEFQFTPFNGVFDAIYFITATPHSQPNFMLDNDLAHDIFILPEWNLPGLKTEARIWPASKGSGWSVIAAFRRRKSCNAGESASLIRGSTSRPISSASTIPPTRQARRKSRIGRLFSGAAPTSRLQVWARSSLAPLLLGDEPVLTPSAALSSGDPHRGWQPKRRKSSSEHMFGLVCFHDSSIGDRQKSGLAIQ